ncbi:exonuclease domain-containing protein [Sphingobacterium thalpophilum]|uniref:Exonuclease domain-containing protein n=1 Tax=Sphingobacterium thalpophilum TaxID=259 RepID=A0ACD5C588_9SPHI|nr:exonuclease domain-containing protein [Sphingobacterium multivorum]
MEFLYIIIAIVFLGLLWAYSAGAFDKIPKKGSFSTLSKEVYDKGQHLKDEKDLAALTLNANIEAYIKNEIDPGSFDIKFHTRFPVPIDFHELEFTVIDFETANKNPLSAVSLGIAHFKGQKLLDVKEFRLEPIIKHPWEFEHIHGISINQSREYSTFEKQWEYIKPHLDNRLLVAHNAEFDINVLKETVSFIKQKLTNIRVVCTYKLAKRFMKYESSYKLENLCKDNGIPYWNHKAAYDAVSAGILFMHAISQAPGGAISDSAMNGKRVAIK